MKIETIRSDDIQAVDSLEPAPPVTNRFLFVDIAALRAKQLRRGARPRIEPAIDHHPAPHKAERVAMEEVRRQKVQYDLPPAKPPVRSEPAA